LKVLSFPKSMLGESISTKLISFDTKYLAADSDRPVLLVK